MSFQLTTFINIIDSDKKDAITLKKEDGNPGIVIHINRKHLSNYTDFFATHKGFTEDGIYTIPIDLTIADECIYHIHTLFTNFNYKPTLFLLLQGFDYFCVDSSPYMKKLLELSPPSIHLSIVEWTIHALYSSNEIFIGYLHILYDMMYNDGNLYFFPTQSSIQVLSFLLSRKWLSNRQTRTTILAHSQKMENFFLFLITSFADAQHDTSIFMKLWPYIQPSLLSMDAILDLSKTVYGKLVKEDIISESHKRIGLFGEYFTFTTTRFTLRPGETHHDVLPFFITQHLQVMDRRYYWYNATIIGIDLSANTVRVHFDLFSDIYDETISTSDFYRFLPYNTLSSGTICPCTYCITQIFKTATLPTM